MRRVVLGVLAAAALAGSPGDATAAEPGASRLPRSAPVMIVAESPYAGALGLTCRAEFRAIPGNAQDRCPPGFQGIVLYPAALTDVRTLQNVLAHENFHWTHPTPGPADDPFRERQAYAVACAQYPVDARGVCPPRFLGETPVEPQP